jgi:hypothetical protein
MHLILDFWCKNGQKVGQSYLVSPCDTRTCPMHNVVNKLAEKYELSSRRLYWFC